MRRLAPLALFLSLSSPAVAQNSFLQNPLGRVAGLFSEPTVLITVEHAPALNLEVNRIAFIPEENQPCVEELTNILIENFLREGLEVLEREQINHVLREHGMVAGGLVDPATAIELGKILGATALVFIDVQRCVTDTHRSREGSGDAVTYYSITEGFLKGSMRIVDLTTARIFSAKTLEESVRRETRSSDGYPEPVSEYHVHDELIRQASFSVYRLFFPWSERRELVFFNDSKCNLKAAYHLLRIGEIQEAGAVSRTNLIECKSNGGKEKVLSRAYYNLGMTFLLQDRFDEALEHFQKAYSLRPSKTIARAVNECKRAKAAASELESFEQAGVPSSSSPAAAARQHQDSSSTGSSSTAQEERSFEERLTALQRLRDKGLITDEEYRQKREQILGDL